MSLPSALPSATDKVTWTCPECHTCLVFPEGEKCPPCKCADIPPWEREPIVVYRKTDDCEGHEFMAEAHPVGQRVVRAYGAGRDRVVAEVRRLLKVGSS